MYFNLWKKSLFTLLLLVFLLMPSGLVFAQSTTTARIGFFNPLTIGPGTLVEVPIEIKSVEGLYALDITIHFDPAILAAQDADSATPGIQMAQGLFLDPGLVLFNTIDNTQGTGHFVMTQFNPSEPKSGDGILLVIYFKGLTTGQSKLNLTDVQLSTRDGNPITAQNVDSVIHVELNAPPVVSTSIPVNQTTQMIQIPMLDATITPTATVQITEQAATGNETQQPQGDEENQAVNGESLSSIFGKWWFVLILLVLVIASGIVLLITRRKA